MRKGTGEMALWISSFLCKSEALSGTHLKSHESWRVPVIPALASQRLDPWGKLTV